MAIPVLLALAMLATASYAREINCTADASLCTSTGAQTIMLSGQQMCCPPTATFSLNNNHCKCVVPDVTEEPCLEGVAQCRQAASFGRDSKGTLRCCLPGLALNMVSESVVNGVLLDVCTCSPVSGGFMTSFLGMGSPGAVGGLGSAGPVFNRQVPLLSRPPAASNNASDIRAEWRRLGDAWRNWGRDFSQGFRTWGRSFGSSMRNTGLDLARSLSGVLQSTLSSSLVPLQRAFSGTISNAFNAIPGLYNNNNNNPTNNPNNPRVLTP